MRHRLPYTNVVEFPEGDQLSRFPDHEMLLSMRWGCSEFGSYEVTPEMTAAALEMFSRALKPEEIAIDLSWSLVDVETRTLGTHANKFVMRRVSGTFHVRARAVRLAEYEFVEDGQFPALAGGAL